MKINLVAKVSTSELVWKKKFYNQFLVAGYQEVTKSKNSVNNWSNSVCIIYTKTNLYNSQQKIVLKEDKKKKKKRKKKKKKKKQNTKK